MMSEFSSTKDSSSTAEEEEEEEEEEENWTTNPQLVPFWTTTPAGNNNNDSADPITLATVPDGCRSDASSSSNDLRNDTNISTASVNNLQEEPPKRTTTVMSTPQEGQSTAQRTADTVTTTPTSDSLTISDLPSQPSLPTAGAPTTPPAPTNNIESVMTNNNIDNANRKVKIHLVAVGSAPILKKTKFQIGANQRFAAVSSFVTKMIQQKTVFLYCNSAFVPSPEELVGDLHQSFQIRDELIIHYSLQEAWG